MAASRHLISTCIALLLSFHALLAVGHIVFKERFDDGWESRWVKSDWKKSEGEAGEWLHTAGKWPGDPNDKGIQTTPDHRFFAISAEFPEYTNTDRNLVLQFSVKHEQELDCGGGYVKLLSGDVDQSAFGGDTPYSIMFGPDICGDDNRKLQVILSYKGEYHPIDRKITCEIDQLTHVYTLVIKPNNNYTVLIDNKEKRNGRLSQDFKLLPPKRIKDPNATKPADWEDNEYLVDPEDTKPEGYDDIPAEITDPEATKPADWDDEEDGEWIAPTIPNPEYKGPWVPKKIKNPAYNGTWRAPLIDNPDYKDDNEMYVFSKLKYVGFELWQVKSGSLFDNILVTDDLLYARSFAEATWGKYKDAEKTAFEDAQKKKEEEEAKKDEEEEKEDDVSANEDANSVPQQSDVPQESDGSQVLQEEVDVPQGSHGTGAAAVEEKSHDEL